MEFEYHDRSTCMLDRHRVKTDKLFKKIKEAALAIIVVKAVLPYEVFKKALGLRFLSSM